MCIYIYFRTIALAALRVAIYWWRFLFLILNKIKGLVGDDIIFCCKIKDNRIICLPQKTFNVCSRLLIGSVGQFSCQSDEHRCKKCLGCLVIARCKFLFPEWSNIILTKTALKISIAMVTAGGRKCPFLLRYLHCIMLWKTILTLLAVCYSFLIQTFYAIKLLWASALGWACFTPRVFSRIAAKHSL